MRFGPYKTVPEFHRYLPRGFKAHHDHLPEVCELTTKHEGTWPLHLTHADLSSFNILVRGDDITTLVD